MNHEAPPHPYDHAFGDGIDDRLFPPIAEEAEARDVDLKDPERFLFLGSVGHLLRAVAGPAEDDAGEEPIRQYGRLLYHAFHFWRAGRPTFAIAAADLRRLLEEGPDDETGGTASGGDPPSRLSPPGPAGYLRLPRTLVWAAPSPGLQPEPADGLFWTFVADADPPALHVLMALGVRRDRPGFSVVPVTGLLDDVPDWADIDARPGGTDFETTLPGGEMERLYSVETPAEILKLASRCFRHLQQAGASGPADPDVAGG